MAKKVTTDLDEVKIDRTEEQAIKDVVRAHLNDENHLISEENILNPKTEELKEHPEAKPKKSRKR
jgi:hypothetical protein